MCLPRVLLAVLALVAGVTAVVLVVVVVRQDEPRLDRSVESTATAGSSHTGPRDTLRRWDVRRAEAWASGDAVALRSLYTRRSVAGDRDVAMLQQYADRGLRVRLYTQVLAADVVTDTDSRVVLVVTDRLASAVAVGRDRRVVLPTDEPSTRRITLTRVGTGEWRVAAVTPVSGARSPARP